MYIRICICSFSLQFYFLGTQFEGILLILLLFKQKEKSPPSECHAGFKGLRDTLARPPSVSCLHWKPPGKAKVVESTKAYEVRDSKQQILIMLN